MKVRNASAVVSASTSARRSMYQFGKNLERSAKGNVDTGLGKNVVYGTFGILPPTQLITKPTEELTLDGVHFVFHNVPGAEAPAELTFFIPAKKAYGGAENLAQTMHNLLPVRGAKVRDALRWSNYMDHALEQVRDADVYIASHNWPVWGNASIKKLITMHRDVYKYTHDQTVRLINAGYTIKEIPDMVKLPKSLSEYFGARGYYGDLRHNVKAVYQFYLGAYDGNPANLDPLPPQVPQVGQRPGFDGAAGPDDRHPVRQPLDLGEHVAGQQHGAPVRTAPFVMGQGIPRGQRVVATATVHEARVAVGQQLLQARIDAVRQPAVGIERARAAGGQVPPPRARIGGGTACSAAAATATPC